VRVRVSGPFALTFMALAAASGHAQVAPLSPPPSGFVSSYEIMQTLRSAGFDPLAPPLREGTTYVARATDYRGILMRVVLDARTGAIRDANRIVSGPGSYEPGAHGQVGMLPSPDDVPPPYGLPVGLEPQESPLGEQGASPLSALPGPHPVTRASVTIFPPLPRPRPAELAARPALGTPEITPADETAPKPGAKSDSATDTKPAEIRSDVTTAAPLVSSPPPAASPPAPAKPGKAPALPSIND
jgi:hypothetical protein